MDFSRYTALQVETADKITTITINRPEARNAINAELHHEFTRIWRRPLTSLLASLEASKR